MTPFKIATALAALTLIATTAIAQEVATTPTPPAFTPGWRHEQMMQARAQGQMMPVTPGQRGPGMGAGMGWGGGPPLKADGTVDTARLPDGCPMKASLRQSQ